MPPVETKEMVSNDVLRQRFGSDHVPEYVAARAKHTSNGKTLVTDRLDMGDVVLLLFFEGAGGRQAIMFRDYPLELYINPRYLSSLQSLVEGNPTLQRGVIFLEQECSWKSLPSTLKGYFPDMDLEVLSYDRAKVGEIYVTPSQRRWGSSQHGDHTF